MKLAFLSRVKTYRKKYAQKTDDELRDIALDLGFESRQSESVAKLIERGFALVFGDVLAENWGWNTTMSNYLAAARCAKDTLPKCVQAKEKHLRQTLPMFIYSLSGRGALLATTNGLLG